MQRFEFRKVGVGYGSRDIGIRKKNEGSTLKEGKLYNNIKGSGNARLQADHDHEKRSLKRR